MELDILSLAGNTLWISEIKTRRFEFLDGQDLFACLNPRKKALLRQAERILNSTPGRTLFSPIQYDNVQTQLIGLSPLQPDRSGYFSCHLQSISPLFCL